MQETMRIHWANYSSFVLQIKGRSSRVGSLILLNSGLALGR